MNVADIELPELPDAISVHLPDGRGREVYSARTWRYVPEDRQDSMIHASDEENARLETLIDNELAEELERLQSENDMLRELVRDMMRFFEDGDWCTHCKKVKECDAQEVYEEDCLMRYVFHDHMRELGVEVDDD